MSNRKFDWKTIEQQYITGEMSLRELARLNGIVNHSLVMAQSTRNGWAQKREDFRSRADDKTLTLMADDEARRRAKEARVRDNAIEAIDEAITKMRADMKLTRKRYEDGEWVEGPAVLIKPADVALLIDRLNVLFGRPANITEERSLGVSLSAGGTLGPDVLRGIVEATRGIAPSGSERSPLPRIGGAGSN